MAEFRVDVYSNPHKELRAALFSLAQRAASAVTKNDVTQVVEEARAVLTKLSEHARAEDTYLHPIIRPKIAQHLAALHETHEELEEYLQHVSKTMELLAQASGDDLVARLRDFNHEYNKLVGHHLIHMAYEESSLPLYWQHCETHELFAVMLAFKSNEEPEAFPFVMGLARQHLSEDKLLQSFGVIHERLGEPVFQRTWDSAKTLLPEHLLNKIQNEVRG